MNYQTIYNMGLQPFGKIRIPLYELNLKHAGSLMHILARRSLQLPVATYRGHRD